MTKPGPSSSFYSQTDRVGGCPPVQCAISDPLRPMYAKYLSETLSLECIKSIFKTLSGLPRLCSIKENRDNIGLKYSQLGLSANLT